MFVETTVLTGSLIKFKYVTNAQISWRCFSQFNKAHTCLRPLHTRGFAPGACSRGTLREQSSSVCTNEFMGILHPREQNFHPAKCSTIFNRLNTWEQAPGANNAPSCVLTRAKWSWSMLREQNPSCVSALIIDGTWYENLIDANRLPMKNYKLKLTRSSV